MMYIYGKAGSIIMDASSLFFLVGILIYTSLYRKRGRLDDRIFFAMISVNLVYVIAELLSYTLEGIPVPFMRDMMIAENTAVYAAMVLFPYLLMLYTYFRVFKDQQRLRRAALWFGIPCLAYFVVLGLNLKTGWIFTIDESCMFIDGTIDQIVLIPILFYFMFCIILVSRIDIRLVFLGMLLLVVRMVWDIWFRPIQSTTFIYTLYLAVAHIYLMNEPLTEENA